jgi:uracil-DNA glycosylase
MSDHSQFIENLITQSLDVVKVLKADTMIGKYIDDTLPIPRPFVGTGEIRLVILGQDPTVKAVTTRKKIATVLMLDQTESNLRKFLTGICTCLEILLDENVYATNVSKNFFTAPPKKLTTDVIGLSWPKWRPLLVEELARFPNAAILTLGKPILQVLVRDPAVKDLKHYWGYVGSKAKKEHGEYRLVEVQHSTVDRPFFPFPHITNISTTELYRTHRDNYLSFVRNGLVGGMG